MMEDIVGEVANQKEVHIIANSMKEARSIRSFDTFKWLSRVLIFPDGFNDILEVIYPFLREVNDEKSISKIRDLLHKLSVGKKNLISLCNKKTNLLKRFCSYERFTNIC